MKNIVIIYTLLIAFLMVSNIPTYSGKLLGERISREWVLPIFVLAVLYVATLVTYPHETLAGTSIFYLAMIPVGWRRFQKNLAKDAAGNAGGTGAPPVKPPETGTGAAGGSATWASPPSGSAPPGADAAGKDSAPQGSKSEPPESKRDGGRVVELRTPEPRS